MYNRKPVKITFYNGYDKLRNALRDLGLKFSERHFPGGMYSFSGIEFTIEKATGKGSRETNRILRQLASPFEYKKTKWFR
jgi:hypothetical protein